MATLYVHIPFCESRCVYCGFYSTTLLEQRQRYIDALCKELEARSEQPERITSIYLGGGTPSQLPPAQLEQLLSHIYNRYQIVPDAEVTIECNPDDMTDDYAHSLRALPVNRVSMGLRLLTTSACIFSTAATRPFRCRRLWSGYAKQASATSAST